MRRREFVGFLGGAAAWPVVARAQQAARMMRIGVIYVGSTNNSEAQTGDAIFRSALQELGWTDGANLRIDYRWLDRQDPELLRTYVVELLGLQPNVILAQSTPVVAALQRETKTIPVVFFNVSEPVGSGFVTSLAHPGGNATGFSNFEYSMPGKSIALLKEAAPLITRAAFLHNPQTLPGGTGSAFLHSFETAASSIGLETVAAHIDDNNSVESVLGALGREAGCGVVVSFDIFTSNRVPSIIDFSTRYRLPAAYSFSRFTKAGGLMSYGVDPAYPFREAAAYIDQLLKGASPSNLPVQLPTKFHIAINLKAAKAIGLAVPESFLLRADEVIE